MKGSNIGVIMYCPITHYIVICAQSLKRIFNITVINYIPCKFNVYNLTCRLNMMKNNPGKNALYRLKVMLHETIRKNDF